MLSFPEIMEDLNHACFLEQKNRMLDRMLGLARDLNEERKRIAKPYVLALKKQFPDKDYDELIKIADADLQESNDLYKRITQKSVELQEFSQGPFQELVRLIKQA